MVMVDRRPSRRIAREAELARRRAEKKARRAIPVTPPPKPLPPTKPPRPKPTTLPKPRPRRTPAAVELERLLTAGDGLFAATAVVMLGKHLVRARLRSGRAEAEHVEFQADTPEAAAALIARLDPFQLAHGARAAEGAAP